MTSLAITLIVAVVAFAFVLAPILRRKGGAPVLPNSAPNARPIESALPNALEELELDRAMGKVDAADFERLRASILSSRRTSPAAMLADVGNAVVRLPETPASAENEAPAPVSSAATGDPFADEAERLIAAAKGSVARCATCGDRPEPGAAYCSTCGASLNGCAVCGAAQPAPGARFCVACGAAFAR